MFYQLYMTFLVSFALIVGILLVLKDASILLALVPQTFILLAVIG